MENASLTPFSEGVQINDTESPMEGIISLWVHGKSPHTQRYYRIEATKFLAMVGKPLPMVVLADVQAYVTVLERSDLAASSQARAIAAVKPLSERTSKKRCLGAIT